MKNNAGVPEKIGCCICCWPEGLAWHGLGGQASGMGQLASVSFSICGRLVKQREGVLGNSEGQKIPPAKCYRANPALHTRMHVYCTSKQLRAMEACVYQQKICRENCFRSKGQHSTCKNTGRNFVLRSMLSNAKINIIINSSHPLSVRTPWRSNYHHKMVCCWENWLL